MPLEVIIGFVGLIVAMFGVYLAQRERDKNSRAEDLQQVSSLINQKLDTIKEDTDEMKSDISTMQKEITSLKVSVEVHDVIIDRDKARPLRAVNE